MIIIMDILFIFPVYVVMVFRTVVVVIFVFVSVVLCEDAKKDRGEGVHYSIHDGIEMLDADNFR